MALVEIGITGNGGYGPDQVRKMEVAELISELEAFEPEDKIYLYDSGNRHGAAYGYINYVSAGSEDEEDEDDMYESSLYSKIKTNLKESDFLNDSCLDALRLIHDNMNMITTMEDDELKFKLMDTDSLLCYALEIKAQADRLVNTLRDIKNK